MEICWQKIWVQIGHNEKILRFKMILSTGYFIYSSVGTAQCRCSSLIPLAHLLLYLCNSLTFSVIALTSYLSYLGVQLFQWWFLSQKFQNCLSLILNLLQLGKPLHFSLAMTPCMSIPSLLQNSFCHFSTMSSDKWHSFIFYKDTSNDWFYLSPLIYILKIYFPSITYYIILLTSNGGKKNNT